MSRLDPDPDEVRNPHPYDYAEAKRAIARAARDQRAAEKNLREAGARFSEKERCYRVALARKIADLRGEWPATVCADMARGDTKVAQLRYERDVAETVKEAAVQALWTHAADRRELEQLIAWSMKVAPLGEQRQGDYATA